MPAEKSSGWPFGMALASSHARASARNAASSGVSSKSTVHQTRTGSSQEPIWTAARSATRGRSTSTTTRWWAGCSS